MNNPTDTGRLSPLKSQPAQQSQLAPRSQTGQTDPAASETAQPKLEQQPPREHRTTSRTRATPDFAAGESVRSTAFVKTAISPERSTDEKRRLLCASSPGVVPVVGDDECGSWIPGEPLDAPLMLARAACSLADVLHERGPLTDEEVRAVAAAAARALRGVHEAGLVHGDVKPANLLLSHAGDLWLCDFDSAVEADGQPLRRFTPERVPADAVAEPQTDLTALAVMLIELATGVGVDPHVRWRASDLRRIGCSAELSVEIAFALNAATPAEDAQADAALDARCFAEMFHRGDALRLPAPARRARMVDPTPTIDFPPVRRPESRTANHEPTASKSSPFRRLAAMFTPADLAPETSSSLQRQRLDRHRA